MTLAIQQDISGCFSTASGLSPADLQPYLQRCEIARTHLLNSLKEPQFSAFSIAYSDDDLAKLVPLAEEWRNRFQTSLLWSPEWLRVVF